jgi:ribosome-associated toxin RatA of RatAB toxin-antitoxin module
MSSVSASAQVAATPREFFDATLAVSQIPGYGEWHPAFANGAIRMLKLTDGVGTTFEFALQGTGATARAEVIEYTPERFVAQVRGGIFARGAAMWTVVPRGASCTATYEFEYRPRFQPFGAIIDLLMLRPRLRRLAEDVVEACKQRAEVHAMRVGASERVPE